MRGDGWIFGGIAPVSAVGGVRSTLRVDWSWVADGPQSAADRTGFISLGNGLTVCIEE